MKPFDDDDIYLNEIENMNWKPSIENNWSSLFIKLILNCVEIEKTKRPTFSQIINIIKSTQITNE